MPFVIQPHTRIQEWVALEKGYFDAEGLEYQLTESFAAKLAAYLPNFQSKLYHSKHEIIQPMRDDIKQWLNAR